MTIDERLKRLTIAASKQDGQNIRALLRIAEMRERGQS
jgi:hypothetical protein